MSDFTVVKLLDQINLNYVSWANVDKTTSDIADLSVKSHTSLTDIGTNTHDQIDTALGTTIPATYLKLDQTTPQTITNDSPIFNTLTASQLMATDANKKLQSLAVATYPSLTEISYVKGLTSAVQTQLNGRLVLAGVAGGQTAIGGTGVTDILKLQGTLGNGTAGSPAIQGLVGNNGATVAFTVLNSGNVGIGTTSPIGKLAIVGGTGDGESVNVYNGSTKVISIQASNSVYGPLIQFSNSTGGFDFFSWRSFVASGSYDYVWNSKAAGNSGLERMRISGNADVANVSFSNSNVGIGTTSPNRLFNVNGVSSFEDTVYFQNGTVGLWSWSTSVFNRMVHRAASGYALSFGSNGISDRMVLDTNGNVGIGTTSPTNLLSITGQSAKTIWSERNVTSNTAGVNLTLRVGGATVDATDKNGGTLILAGGTSTGTGTSGVQIQTCPAGGSGTSDNTLTTIIEAVGNTIGVFSQTPVIRQAHIADLKTDYTTGDLDTEAEIITAINTTNTAFNSLLAKLEAYGWLNTA